MKQTRRERYLLPSEYLGDTPAHPAMKAALRRGRPALVGILSLPVAGYVWCGVREGYWGWGILGVVISAGFGYMVWHALALGFVETNHGAFLRASRPLGFWLSVVFMALGFAVGLASLIFAQQR